MTFGRFKRIDEGFYVPVVWMENKIFPSAKKLSKWNAKTTPIGFVLVFCIEDIVRREFVDKQSLWGEEGNDVFNTFPGEASR